MPKVNFATQIFLEGTTASGVQRLVNQGANANGICNQLENRPLHQALLFNADVSAEVIRALINNGADVTAENDNGDTPLEFSEVRFEEAVAAFQNGQITFQQFKERQAVYEVVNSGLEALSTAYQNLCDTNWWRSASGESTFALIQANPGIDPNRSCNPGNDRPLHIVLRIIEPLSSSTGGAILTFIDNTNVDFQARNNSHETPASLLEVRYDRLKIRISRDLSELCQNITQASKNRYGRLADQYHGFEADLYARIKELMGEAKSIVMTRLHKDFFGNPQGFLSFQETCAHIRNNRVVNPLH